MVTQEKCQRKKNDRTDCRSDLPPENESSFMLDWKLRKGALDGQKVLHARANYQQAS
jgi:hypothetical protein